MMTSAKPTFSNFGHLTSGPCSTLLTKYIRCCCWTSSHTKAPAIVMSLTERYKSKGLLAFGLLSIGGDERYLLNSMNTALHSDPHSKVLSFFKREERGKAFRADATINLESDAILLVRHCTSLPMLDSSS